MFADCYKPRDSRKNRENIRAFSQHWGKREVRVWGSRVRLMDVNTRRDSLLLQLIKGKCWLKAPVFVSFF
jgi:hypothetical protein